MASLIVLVPSSDTLGAGDWSATPMWFALLGRHGETLRCGQARCAELPKADTTTLVIAARDTLLLHAKLPLAAGNKLRRVLPNVVEEHLIQDAQRCHVAVGPAATSDTHCLAVIDRDRFSALIEGFIQAGHRRLRAVPLIHCIPLPQPVPVAPIPPMAAIAAEVPGSQDNPDAAPVLTNVAAGIDADAGVGDEAGHGDDGNADRDHSARLTSAPSTLLIVPATRANASPETLLDARGDVTSDMAVMVSAPSMPSADAPGWELALRHGTLGFGLSINAAQLDTTLGELAQRGPLTVYRLSDDNAGADNTEDKAPPSRMAASQSAVHGTAHSSVSAPPRLPASVAAPSADAAGRPVDAVPPIDTLALSAVAKAALACRFDLCQFEFADAVRQRIGAGGLKPWRVALVCVAATLLLSIAALNLQWWRLAQRSNELAGQMTALVKTVFPGTASMLDPHLQMASELARLRASVGELRSGDYLALASSLAHALGPLPSTSLAELDYSGGALEVTFKTGTEIDEDGFKRRLAAAGLSAQEDNGKWILKPAPSGTR